MDLGAISARLTLNINEFSSNLRRVEEEIKNTERQFSGFSDIGGRFENLGQKLTLGVTVPIVGIGIAASKASMDFEAQMSRVSAISGATGEDLRKLNDQAMQLGADTAFSSKQAAEGMENLASAGFNVTEIMQAMPGMLDLAASGGVEIAQASDIAASALRGFGLEANQAGHVADVIAKAAADTNAGVIDMGEAMKYVAPIAHSMGISLEETSAAIGLMSNAGIQGSQSGTTLRSALTRLANPSKEAAGTMKELGFNAFDSNGKMKSLSEIIGQLSDKTKNLTQEQKQQAIAEIFGQEAMSGMLVLMGEGKDKVSELTTNFKNSDGAAKEMAQTMQDNVKGAIDQMGGSLETAGIKIGNVLAPMIRNAANTVTELTNKFSQLSPETQESIVKFGLLAASVGPVVMIFGKLFSSVTAIAGGIKTVSSLFGTAKIATAAVGTAASTAVPAIGGMGTAFAGALVPLLPWIAGIGAAGFAIYKLVNYFKKDAIPSVDLFADAVKTTTHTVTTSNGQVINSYGQTTVKISEATKKAVGAYMDLDKKASKSLMDLRVNSDKFTQDAKNKVLKNFNDMSKKADKIGSEIKNNMVTDFKNLVNNTGTLTDKNKKDILSKYTAMVNGCSKLTNKQKQDVISDFNTMLKQSTAITNKQKEELITIYSQMEKQITDGMDKDYTERSKLMQEFFSTSKTLTDKEEKDILLKMGKSNEAKKAEVTKAAAQIKAIAEKASKENRQINAEEQQQINTLQETMKTNAIKTLSANELEAKVIMDRIKEYGTRITAEQASEVIQNAEKQRVESVDKANRQYEETKAAIQGMVGTVPGFTQQMADKLIADAERQRKESIDKANALKEGVVGKITEMNSSIGKSVDLSTGAMLKTWGKLKAWWENWKPSPKKFEYGTSPTDNGSIVLQQYAKGTDGHPGGLAVAGEEGEELTIGPDGEIGLTADTATLYNLPKGTKVIPHGKTKGILSSLNVPGYKDGTEEIDSWLPNFLKKAYNSKEKYAVQKISIAEAEKTGGNKRSTADNVDSLFDRVLIPLDGAMDRLLIDTGNLNKNLENQNKALGAQEAKVKILDAQWKASGYQFGYASDEAVSAKKNLESATTELEELKGTVKKTQEEINNNYAEDISDLSSRVLNALKEKYEEQQKLEEERIQNSIELNEKWKEKSLESIDEVYSAKIDALDKECDVLERNTSIQLRGLEDTEKATERNINAQLDLLDSKLKQHDTTLQDQEDSEREAELRKLLSMNYSKQKKEELQKELDELLKAREERKYRESIETQKEALTKQLQLSKQESDDKKEELSRQLEDEKYRIDQSKQALENEREEKEKAINSIYEFEKDKYEQQLKNIEKFYENKLKDANLNAEAEKMIINNSQKEIVNLLRNYGAEYEVAGQTLGERLMAGIMPGIESVKDMINSISTSLTKLPSIPNMSSGSIHSVSAPASSSITNTVKNNQQIGSLLSVDKIVLNNGMDVETLANELEYYRQKIQMSKGGISFA